MEKKPKNYAVKVFVKPLPPYKGSQWLKGVVITNERKGLEEAVEDYVNDRLRPVKEDVRFQITIKEITLIDDFVLNLTKK
jgi:hypothetical protein